MDDPKLHPSTVLAALGGRLASAFDVEVALGIPREHKARRAELREVLSAMVGNGWLGEHVSEQGEVRWMAVNPMQRATKALERIAAALERPRGPEVLP